jgi:hypothetical protein
MVVVQVPQKGFSDINDGLEPLESIAVLGRTLACLTAHLHFQHR